MNNSSAPAAAARTICADFSNRRSLMPTRVSQI
jgi:hypothetical protein